MHCGPYTAVAGKEGWRCLPNSAIDSFSRLSGQHVNRTASQHRTAYRYRLSHTVWNERNKATRLSLTTPYQHSSTSQHCTALGPCHSHYESSATQHCQSDSLPQLTHSPQSHSRPSSAGRRHSKQTRYQKPADRRASAGMRTPPTKHGTAAITHSLHTAICRCCVIIHHSFHRLLSPSIGAHPALPSVSLLPSRTLSLTMRSVSLVLVAVLALLVQLLLCAGVVQSVNYKAPNATQIAALQKYQNIIVLVESAASFDFLFGQLPTAEHRAQHTRSHRQTTTAQRRTRPDGHVTDVACSCSLAQGTTLVLGLPLCLCR